MRDLTINLKDIVKDEIKFDEIIVNYEILYTFILTIHIYVPLELAKFEDSRIVFVEMAHKIYKRLDIPNHTIFEIDYYTPPINASAAESIEINPSRSRKFMIENELSTYEITGINHLKVYIKDKDWVKWEVK